MSAPVDLESIRQRLDAATPGPWHYDGYAHVSKTRGRTDMVASAHDPDDGSHCTKRAEANARFIAAAPEDIRGLVAEVGRLRRIIQTLREALEEGPKLIAALDQIRPDAMDGAAKMLGWWVAASHWVGRARRVLGGPE